MTSPAYSVPVADLEKGPKAVSWVLPQEWLSAALGDTDATPRASGSAELELSLNGREVLVRGLVKVAVTMPCVATLEPVELDLTPEVFLLLQPAPTPIRAAAGRRRGAERGQTGTPRRLQSAGNDTKGWSADPELAERDAATDTYDGERIVLDDFLREFIVLELPMSPRRSDLLSGPDAANPPVPRDPVAASGPSVDPRLAPLVEIASRMRKSKE